MADAFDALLSGAPQGGEPAFPAAPQLDTPVSDQPLGDPSSFLESAAGGVAKGIFETKDAALELAGQTSEKSPTREGIEKRVSSLENVGGVPNGLARGISEFGTGFIGLGKVLGPLKWAGKLYDAGRGAATGAIAFDPHEARLSNFVQEFPSLQNPVSAFLAASPDDSKAEGRLKSAVESLVLPGAVEAGVEAAKYSVKALTSTVRAIKLRRSGDLSGANAAVDEADTALAQAEKADDRFPGLIKPAGMSEQEWNTTGRWNAIHEKAGAKDASSTAESPGGSPAGAGDPAAIPGSETQTTADLHAPQPGGASGADGVLPDGRLPKVAGEVKDQATNVTGQLGAAADTGQGQGGGGLERIPSGVRLPRDGALPVRVEVTPEQTASLIQKAQKDTGAILDAGSVDAAQAEGHAFAETDLIPWQKLATGNERVDTWMQRVVSESEPFINKERGGNAAGVLTDKRVDQMVNARAAAFGEDPAVLRGLILRAGDQSRTMAANMETAYVIASKGMQDTYGLAMRINAGNLGGFETVEAAQAALKSRLQNTLEMFAAAKTMTAAAGRSLRRMRGEFAANGDALQKLNIQNADPDQLTKLILSTQGDPQAMAALSRPGWMSNLVDHAATLQAANLLWGWATHTINLTMNVAALYGRPLLQSAGGSILQIGGKVRGDDALMAAARSARMQARYELINTHTFMGDAWNSAKWAFLNGDSKLAPHDASEFTAVSQGTQTAAGTAKAGAQRAGVAPLAGDQPQFRAVNGMEDVAHNALQAAMFTGSHLGGDLWNAATVPLRLMGAADEAVKTMRYRAVVAAKADADAMAQGLRPGSPQYAAYLEQRVRGAFDVNGAALDADALSEARVTTYQQPLLGSGTDDTWQGWKSAGAAIQQGVNAIPPARFILPFVKTPTNLFRYGIKLTPGVNMLQKEYLNALTGAKGVQAQAMATGEMMLGITLAGVATTLKLNGRITGGGPADPKAAKAWKDDGHMPYSFVIPGKNGEPDKYLQYNRFDPVTSPLGLVADFADILMQGHLNQDQEHGMAMSIVLAFSHQLKSKTYLQNIAQVLDGLTDDNKMQSLPQRLAPGMLPLSTLLQGVTQIEDPVQHEIHGVFDALKARTPGMSDSVPPHRDAFGDKVMNPGKFYSANKNPDPLARALDESNAATGGYLQPPSPRVGNGFIDLRDVTLESGRNAYDRYQELAGNPTGKLPVRDVLNKIVQSDAYKILPHGKVSEEGTKEWVLEKQLRENRDAALGLLKAEKLAPGSGFKTFGDMSIKRTQDLYGQLGTNIKDLRAAQSQGAASAVDNLLKPFGLSMPTPASVPAAQQ